MLHQRTVVKRPLELIALAMLAATLLVAIILIRPSFAHANLPTCGAQHSSYATSNCTNSGVIVNVRCGTANLRAGPGIDFALHGSVVSGNNGNRYKIVWRGSAVNAGCGGASTNEWWLSLSGWITRSALW
jgi:hypothetical protein